MTVGIQGRCQGVQLIACPGLQARWKQHSIYSDKFTSIAMDKININANLDHMFKAAVVKLLEYFQDFS